MEVTTNEMLLIELIETAMEFKPLLLAKPGWHLAAKLALKNLKTPLEQSDSGDKCQCARNETPTNSYKKYCGECGKEICA